MSWLVTVVGAALSIVLLGGAPASASSQVSEVSALASGWPECKYLRAGANKTITGHCRPAAGKTKFSVGFLCFPDTTAAQRYHSIRTTSGGWVIFSFNSGCWGSLRTDSLSVHDF